MLLYSSSLSKRVETELINCLPLSLQTGSLSSRTSSNLKEGVGGDGGEALINTPSFGKGIPLRTLIQCSLCIWRRPFPPAQGCPACPPARSQPNGEKRKVCRHINHGGVWDLSDPSPPAFQHAKRPKEFLSRQRVSICLAFPSWLLYMYRTALSLTRRAPTPTPIPTGGV